MFCPNCGYKLENMMRFCPSCGERVSTLPADEYKSSNVKKTASTSSAKSEGQMTIYGVTVNITNIARVHSIMMARFEKHAESGKKQIESSVLYFKTISKDMNMFLLGLQPDTLFKESIDRAMAYLEANKNFSYSRERFIKELVQSHNFGRYLTALETIKTAIDDINANKDEREIANKISKASRTKVVGGGFGLSGAAKGVMMAGAINATTGLMHSIGNGLDKIAANAAAKKKIKAIVNSELENYLKTSFECDCYEIFSFACSILGIENEYTEEGSQEADILIQKLKDNQIPESSRSECMVKAILLKPYSTAVLKFAYDTFGPDDGNLKAIIKAFGNNFDIDNAEKDVSEEKEIVDFYTHYFGDKADYIRNKLLKYSPYRVVLEENLGKPWAVVYKKIIEIIPPKFARGIITYPQTLRIASTDARVKKLGINPNEKALLMIDYKRYAFIAENVLVFTNESFRNTKSNCQLCYDTLNRRIFESDQPQRTCDPSISYDDRDDIQHLLEVFMLLSYCGYKEPEGDAPYADAAETRKVFLRKQKDYDSYFNEYGKTQATEDDLYKSIYDGECYNMWELGIYIENTLKESDNLTLSQISAHQGSRKLRNDTVWKKAFNNYLNELGFNSDKEVIVFIYDGGGSGFTLTDKGLYIKSSGIFGSKRLFNSPDVPSLEIKWVDTWADRDDLFIGGLKVNFMQVNKTHRKRIVDLLRFLMDNAGAVTV